MERRSFLRHAGTAGIGMLFAPRIAAQELPRPQSFADFAGLSQAEQLEGEVAAQWMREKALFAAYRPNHLFWGAAYARASGELILGSAVDGEIVAELPLDGDWKNPSFWRDQKALAAVQDVPLRARITRRQNLLSSLTDAGFDMLHTVTNGDKLIRKLPEEGPFLKTLLKIYASFGIPWELAAQNIVESHLDPRAVNQRTGAFGMSQWLLERWQVMQRRARYPMHRWDRFMQLEHSAAYLALQAGVFESFIAAISGYHTGETNIGKLYITADELFFARDRTEAYLRSADAFRAVRARRSGVSWSERERLKSLDGSFGPESWKYPGNVLACVPIIEDIIEQVEQEDVYCMQVFQPVSRTDLMKTFGWDRRELARWNPHVINRILPDEPLYVPDPHRLFSQDVTYWDDPMPERVAYLLREWRDTHLELDIWHPKAYGLLENFQTNFESTGTRQGMVFGTVLELFKHDARRARRDEVLAEYRADPDRQSVLQDLRREG